MKSEQIVSWLRDKAARAEGRDYRKMLTVAAEKIVELETELREEMHRHDRLQDFEVAEAEELRKARERNRWIPVTERLPDEEFWENQKRNGDEDLEVLVMIKGAKCSTTLLYSPEDGFYELNRTGRTYYIVTYWMPLPEKGAHEHDEM